MIMCWIKIPIIIAFIVITVMRPLALVESQLGCFPSCLSCVLLGMAEGPQ